MPFWQLVDEAPTNHKIKALTAPVLMEGDVDGVAAIGMWALAGATSQAKGSDGLLSLADLVGIVPDRPVAERLAHRLVVAGLWHEHGHGCPRCDPVDALHWRFHDWWDLRYKRAEDMRLAWAKGKENKRPEVTNAVWLRDCVDPTLPMKTLTAHCRYCGKLVKRADHTSEDAPQLDHVDPRLAAGPANLVVACGPCNRRKASRTPADADMVLRPAPRSLAPALAAVSPGSPVAEKDPAGPGDVPPAEPRASQPTTTGSRASQESPPAHVRGRVPGHAPGSGSGAGSGLGTGSGVRSDAGSGSPPAQPTRNARRRRRGGSSRTRPSAQAQPGAAPLVFDPPAGGSPWKDWRGPRSPVSEENICTVHGRHVPCDRCAATSSRERP